MTRLLSNVIKSNYVKIAEDKIYNIQIPNIFGNSVPKATNNPEVKKEPKKEVKKENTEELIKSAQKQANDIIDNAQREAANIINQATNDANIKANQILANAQKEGYNDGYNQAIGEVNSMKVQVQQQLDLAIQQKEQTLQAIEPNVVEMVLKISNSIFGKMLDIDPELILLLMKKGLSETSSVGQIQIHISSDDYEFAIQNKIQLDEFVGNNAQLEIIKDLSLEKGDCIIETPFGNIDSSFEQQFESIKNELFYILDTN